MIYDTRSKYEDNIMSQDADISKIIKEDILRIINEAENKKISLKSIKVKVCVSEVFISKAVSKLRKENSIKFRGNFIELTENGQSRANSITKRHLIIENYFKRTENEVKAHKAANVLEHYISEEVANNIRKLSTLKGSGVPLVIFEIDKEGLIADIMLKDDKLLERIISMGIFPGERIKVINETSNAVIVKVKGKKIALGREIAKRIMVLEYERL